MQQTPFDDDLRSGPGAASEKNSTQPPPDVKMTRLAESFRCLEYKPGVRPWDAAALAEWASSGEGTDPEMQAAAFVLEVASMAAVWEGVPSFKMHDAALAWSKDDRAAFAAWIQAPWYL